MITRDDFLTVAKQMNIKKASNIVDQVNVAVKKWERYAAESGVDTRLRNSIGKTLITN